MQLYSHEDKIEKYLVDLSEEYKELLLKRLLETSGSIENLNVSDLLRIDMEIKKPLIPSYRKKKRMQSIFLMAGTMYALVGIMMLLFFEINDSYVYEGMSLMALVVTFVGLLMSIFSVMIPSNYIEKKEITWLKEDNRAILEYNVVKSWREIEGIATDLYSETKVIPAYSIIDAFFQDGYINKEQSEKLREILKMRNNIVHNIDNNYSLKEIQNMIFDTNVILDKIKKLSKI